MGHDFIETRTLSGAELRQQLPRLEAFVAERGCPSLCRHPRWLLVLQEGLRHEPYCLEAIRDDQTVGLLPLAFVRSRLFGRFLVSLPYLNSAGALAAKESVRMALVDRAVQLADTLDVRYLELRHEERLAHPVLTHELTSKVHLRLVLPTSADELWESFRPKVRNQIRKGEKGDLTVHWGAAELLGEFYRVFAENMRDLGTPVFSRRLFRSILTHFPGQAELCVTRLAGRPVAAALLVHGAGLTEVPSASSLRRFNSTNANMVMYWHLLRRAIERGQAIFDFGRSTVDSNTFRFKRQWGAEPYPAVWQYYVRSGTMGDMRPDNRRYRLMIRLWQRLPVALTRLVGPPIVRGIP